MNYLMLLLLLPMFSLSCICQLASAPISPTTSQDCKPFIYERLRDYFDRNEKKADQIINNNHDPGALVSRTQKIKIGKHNVEWIDKVVKNDSESSVRINGELISLKDKITANAPDGDSPLELSFVGEWRQIKLYKFYQQEIIAIAIGSRMCTGLMCGVGAQLWYDVKTKEKTFFGTYRTDFDVRLFRFTNEEKFYVVSTNFDGDLHGVTSPTVITYQLYELQPDGKFRSEENAKGGKYFIRHTIFPDIEFAGDKLVRKNKVVSDLLEQNWIEEIK